MKTLSQTRSGFTFDVDNVKPATKMISSEPLGESLSRRFLRKILILSQAEKPMTNPVMESIPAKQRAEFRKHLGSRNHALIDAVHTAFSEHYPLVLTPDAIWLVIAQGFSHHITENAKVLRGRLVRHKGKARLTQTVEDLSLDSFEKSIEGFSTQIRDASDPVLYDTLVCDFSTTTPVIRTTSEVVLMDTYSSYFEYMLRCSCGIPRITVMGTVEDWQRIRQRVEVLETYDLSWWVRRLRPILDEFIRTVEGKPDLRFWQAIYKPKETYGAMCATGWIADLFPYLDDAPRRCRNHIFNYRREGWTIPADKGVNTSRLPFDP